MRRIKISASVQSVKGAVCAVFESVGASRATMFQLGSWAAQAGGDTSMSTAIRIVAADRSGMPLGLGAECLIKAVRDEALRAGYSFSW